MTDDGVGTNIPGSYTIEVPVYVVMSVVVIGFHLDTLTDPAHRGMVVSARDPPPSPEESHHYWVFLSNIQDMI